MDYGLAGDFEASYPGPAPPFDWLGRQAGMPANFLVQLLLTHFVRWADMRRTSMTFMHEVSTFIMFMLEACIIRP